MSQRKATDEQLIEALQHKTVPEVAALFGMHPRRVYEHKSRLQREIQAPIVQLPPAADLTYGELVQDRIRRYKRKMQHEEGRKLINVRVPVEGPYALVFMGDPHVDDDGTDWMTLQRDIQIINDTEGMYACNVGDTTNNWVGRLARLYGEQSTSAKEAWILAEGFIKELKHKWLFLIGGNHDAWSGAGDPLDWITGSVNALYQSSECRLSVNSGKHSIVINARHDFAGHSMWNPAHGVMKAVQMGTWDHISVCGHKHVTGYMPLKSPSGRICHAMQVSSYKIFDRYAREKGFRDQNISPAMVAVVNPAYPDNDPRMITILHDVAEAAEFLRWKREKEAA